MNDSPAGHVGIGPGIGVDSGIRALSRGQVNIPSRKVYFFNGERIIGQSGG